MQPLGSPREFSRPLGGKINREWVAGERRPARRGIGPGHAAGPAVIPRIVFAGSFPRPGVRKFMSEGVAGSRHLPLSTSVDKMLLPRVLPDVILPFPWSSTAAEASRRDTVSHRKMSCD